MWDEKQFFEDFNKESDNIKPSDEFVNRLKGLDNKTAIISIRRKKNCRCGSLHSAFTYCRRRCFCHQPHRCK